MDNINVKVSIIVPVYNVAPYLEKCLDSLINQTLTDIEILAVNDGSTDNSLSILNKYSSLDSRIKVFNKPNGGLSDARNHAFQYINGEYVGFVDSDDFVDLQMYEVMYQKAVETDSEIVECNLHHTFDDYEDTEIGVKETDNKELLMNGRSVVWNKIYKTSWLIDTKVTFPVGLIYEDVCFYSKLMPYLHKISYVDEPFVHYVQRSTSINNFQTLKTLQIFDILDSIYSFYKNNGFFDEYKNALEFLYTRILLCSSFSRMCRIESHKDRKFALRKNYEKLVTTFPNWRKNQYLKSYNGKNSRYMKLINGFTYKLSCIIYPFLITLKIKKSKFR
ncbi:glycosyltransferase [Butyrivibrio sp. XPD2006]|uniref:glycosyltransferase n=1 Tax=Butyrivibrio sp. XPD2006 TaxID=1280668 RepID=UPI0003B30C87|nr:glycosyltransferase [Butyrivibrio sp. XPD2006]